MNAAKQHVIEISAFEVFCRRAEEYILTMVEADGDYRSARELVIRTKHKFGQYVLDSGFSVDDLIKNLDERGIKHPDRSDLYRCVKYAEKADRETMALHVADGWGWGRIKKNFLPDRKSQERVENTLAWNEAPAQTLYEMIEKEEIPEPEKPQVAAFLETRIEGDLEALSVVSSEAPVFVARSDKTVKDIDGWVRQQPCIVCGIEENIHAHHWPTTRGAGGTETIPLCGLHHTEAHSLGIDGWNDLHAFKTVEWLQRSLREALHDRG